MKTISLTLLALAGCTDYGQAARSVSHPPSKSSQTSTLDVPATCPIYSPGGGDVDAVEEAYGKPFAFGCGVAAARGAEPTVFGLMTGDAAGSQLAKLPGDREIGIFRQLRDGDQIEHAKLLVDGDAPAIRAYRSTSNVCAGALPEDSESNRIPVSIVATGDTGYLISLGTLGNEPAQIDVEYDPHAFIVGDFGSFGPRGTNDRFYVNSAPPLADPSSATELNCF